MEKHIKVKIKNASQSIFLQKMLKRILNISFNMLKGKEYAHETDSYLFIYFDQERMTRSNFDSVFETNSNKEVTFEELADYLRELDSKIIKKKEKEFEHLLVEAKKRYPVGTMFKTSLKESRDTYVVIGNIFKEWRNESYPKYTAIYEESTPGLVWTKENGWAEIIEDEKTSKKMTKTESKFKIGQYVDIIKEISDNSYFFKNGLTNLKILNIEKHFGREVSYLLADGEKNSWWVKEHEIKLSNNTISYPVRKKKLKVNSISLNNLNILDY